MTSRSSGLERPALLPLCFSAVCCQWLAARSSSRRFGASLGKSTEPWHHGTHRADLLSEDPITTCGFGTPYAEYVCHVRRFLPRLRPRNGGGSFKREHWTEGLSRRPCIASVFLELSRSWCATVRYSRGSLRKLADAWEISAFGPRSVPLHKKSSRSCSDRECFPRGSVRLSGSQRLSPSRQS